MVKLGFVVPASRVQFSLAAPKVDSFNRRSTILFRLNKREVFVNTFSNPQQLVLEVPQCLLFYHQTATRLLQEKHGIETCDSNVDPHLLITAKYQAVLERASRVWVWLQRLGLEVHAVSAYIEPPRFDAKSETIEMSVNGDLVKQTCRHLTESLGMLIGVPKQDLCIKGPRIVIARNIKSWHSRSALKTLEDIECPQGEMVFRDLTVFLRENGTWRRGNTLKMGEVRAA
ncbi:MAG: hypothetical protein JWN64_502 [Parcubacteria group bacterium]|nr:hypothetical protein [Parcubacteria group bacterium]